MSETQNTQLQTIDIDFIRTLRQSGKGYEANLLLEAYRKDVKKQGRLAFNEHVRLTSLKHKAKGICYRAECNNKADDGFKSCSRCRNRNRHKY